MKKIVRTAIHLHTTYSHDSNQTPADVVAQAAREGIDCVAVTDHDAIDGALEAAAIAPANVRVIVGEEISSRDGHIIGLFLNRWIAPGMTAEETIAAIRAQGGAVLAPHPFATLCDDSLRGAIERIAPLVDAIEIHNAQNPLPWQDWRAARFVTERGLCGYVGCDGHIRGELAPAYQEMPAFGNADEFRAALAKARFVARRYSVGYFAKMIARHFWDKVAPRPLPGFATHYRRQLAIAS